MEILVEVNNEDYASARDAIAPFTELIKSPEHYIPIESRIYLCGTQPQQALVQRKF